jgi:hypothetical protein
MLLRGAALTLAPNVRFWPKAVAQSKKAAARGRLFLQPGMGLD